jgi:hypothetical protein
MPIKKQEHIAETLGALDARISVNAKLNHRLAT